MKKILTIIFLNLFVIYPSQAEDIREFQIEGISIYDSLTKFISKNQILKKKNSYKDKGYMYKSRDFYSITFFKGEAFDLAKFDEIQFHLKDNDNLYIIHSVTGAKHISDKNKCLKEMKKTERELDNLFKGIQKRSKKNYEHASKLGSIYKRTVYYFSDGNVAMRCDTWDRSTGIKDSLVFDIYSKQMLEFLKRAY